jgi:hypothetical protein
MCDATAARELVIMFARRDLDSLSNVKIDFFFYFRFEVAGGFELIKVSSFSTDD